MSKRMTYQTVFSFQDRRKELRLSAVMGFVGLSLALWPRIASAHGDLHERIDAVTARINRDTNNAALYFQRGELRRQHEDWDAALSDFDRAAKLDPKLGGVDLARGKTLLGANKAEAALSPLDRFLARHRDHPDACLTRARALVKLNRYVAAAEDYTCAIRRMPEPMPDHYLERAQAQVAAGNAVEAIKGLDEGLEKLGQISSLQSAAIDFELERKNYDAALARVDKAMTTSTRKEAWLARRGEILESAGRPTQAKEAYAAALAAIKALPASRRHLAMTTGLEAQIRAAMDRLNHAGIQGKAPEKQSLTNVP